jgi:hypothetical protein
VGPYPSHHPPPPKPDGKAIASLLLGVTSIVLCLGAITGLPAIILGSMARRDIDRSQGRLSGSGMAAGGIMAGLFGTGLGLVILMSVLGGAFELAKEEPGPAAPPVPVASGTRSYGSLDVVDLDESKPLRIQLAEAADRSPGKTLVLQTYARTSPECARIAVSLSDRRMQHALANVTLVRVDVERFAPELRAMRVETETHPWFYKLDAHAMPVHGISRSAWGESVPEKRAPVLARFVWAAR